MRGTVAAVVIGALLTLAGCTEIPKQIETDTPSPARTKFLESSDKALSEARTLYEGFVRTSAMVSHERGVNPSRLKRYLTKAAYAREKESIAEIAAQGLVTTGTPKLLKFKSQALDLSRGVVSAYACVDFSKVRVKDGSGRDVTPESRPSRQTSNPKFVVEGGRLVMVEDKTWSGASIC